MGRANVPALIALLEAYMAKGAAQVLSGDANKLSSLLGVFQRLLQFKVVLCVWLGIDLF